MKNKCTIQHTSIENFIPSQALARAAAESFNQVDDTNTCITMLELYCYPL